jgi:multiple sugar transport system substrate-binding protein
MTSSSVRPRRRRSAVLLAMVLLAAACTSRPPTRTDGELVWAIGGIDAAKDGLAHGVADLWNERHPDGPTVRVVALPNSADEQRQLMAIELNAGLEEFDILSLDVVWTGEFAESGWIVDLQDMRRQIQAVTLPAPFQSATWKGKLWAAPFTSGAGILYYRKDLVPTPPTTWEELVKVGTAAARPGMVPFVGQGAQYEGLVVNFLEYFWSAGGGDVLDASGREVRFDEAPAKQALEFMQKAYATKFYPQAFATMAEGEALDLFRSGKAVFMRNWPYAYDELPDKDKLGIAPLPAFDGHGSVSALGGQDLAVSRFSDNIAQAKAFVRFASTEPDVQRLIGSHSSAPTMASVYSDLAGNELLALLAKVLPDARPRPPAPNWAAISDEVQQQVFPVYTAGRGDADDATRAIRDFLALSLRER